jgi:hypothetical protein
MGTIRHITAPDGSDLGLYDHEGHVAFHLDQPVVDRITDRVGNLIRDYEPLVWEGWTSTWTAEIEKHRDAVRAECECGWHGPELPWVPGRLETDEQRTAIMLAWDQHIERDVIEGLTWAQCDWCHEPFPIAHMGRPARYCTQACRQAAYRARIR